MKEYYDTKAPIEFDFPLKVVGPDGDTFEATRISGEATIKPPTQLYVPPTVTVTKCKMFGIHLDPASIPNAVYWLIQHHAADQNADLIKEAYFEYVEEYREKK